MSETVSVFHMRDLRPLFSPIPIDLSPDPERSGNVIILAVRRSVTQVGTDPTNRSN